MRLLIVGAGAVGFHLAQKLSDEAHEVTLIDNDPAKVQHAQDNLDAMVIRGSGASIPVLEKAGLSKTDILVAVTGMDEVNLLACLVADRRQVPVKIARVSHPEFHDSRSILSKEDLGIDLMISPEQECAWEIFDLLNSPAATDLARFAEGKVQLVGLRVRQGAPVAGRSLEDLDRDLKGKGFVVASIIRDQTTEIPTGSSVIEPGDKVLVLAPSDEVASLPPLAGYDPFPLRRVMIAGGSDEAVYLAGHLLQHGVHCTILDRDRDRCRELAELLPDVLVLQGDATDLDLLEMEGVEGVDGFVTLTDRDEINMLAAELAKSCGARRVIPLIHKLEYMSLIERVGLDAAVSPRISAANAILRFVRGHRVAAVATVKGSRAEVLESVITGDSALAGQRVRDVQFPEGSLLGALVREEQVIMPRGDDVIDVDDHAIFVVLPEALSALEGLL